MARRGVDPYPARTRRTRRIADLKEGETAVVAGKLTAPTAESGTLFDGNRPRIVQIDEYDVDLIPAPHLLIVTYPDRPGMMGTIGTVLGKHQVNIAAMVIGRSAPGAQAMVFLTVDDPVRKEILDEIRGGMQVENLWWVRL